MLDRFESKLGIDGCCGSLPTVHTDFHRLYRDIWRGCGQSSEFRQRLLARGHTNDKLFPLFQRTEENATNYMARTEADHQQRQASKKEEAESCIRLHLPHHPDELPSKDIQQLWRDNVAHPAAETPLPKCVNHMNEEAGFEKLVVAYHRPTNLGNLFSIRNIHDRGREVSSYLAE